MRDESYFFRGAKNQLLIINRSPLIIK